MREHLLRNVELQTTRTNSSPHFREMCFRIASTRYPFHRGMVEVPCRIGHGIYDPFRVPITPVAEMSGFAMEPNPIDGICHNNRELLSRVRSAVADVRTGLNRFEHMLNALVADDQHVSRSYVDLIGALVLRGTVDVWYRGEYIAVPLHRLPEWFRDPAAVAADQYQVDDATFRRWADCELDGGAGLTSVPCNYHGCRKYRPLTFYDPHEMQIAEGKAASGVWYCHHHRLPVWSSEQALSDDHLMFLRRVHDSPGCNRQQLGAKKGDTDFLISIGLLLTHSSEARGNARALSFHLTDAGQRLVREHSA